MCVCVYVWPPRSLSLLIIGWCDSIPEHRIRRPLDSVPMFKFLFVSPSVMVLVTSFFPLQYSPGFVPSRAYFRSPLSFRPFCLLSVHIRVFSRPPPAASGTSSSFRRKVYSHPADGRPKFSPGFLSHDPMQVCTLPPDLCEWWYLDWVWVEGRRRRRPL